MGGLYGVPVKRNIEHFPEKQELVAKCEKPSKLKFSPSAPLAFTEHGALMAASVLNSEKAIEMSVFQETLFRNSPAFL